MAVEGVDGDIDAPGDDLGLERPLSGALKGLPSYQDVDMTVTGHTLGEARLIGTYQR